MLRPKAALDPAQFFVFSLSLIDLIDEKLENFISETEYGPYITFAYWLGLISKEELDEIIKNGIVSDPMPIKRFTTRCTSSCSRPLRMRLLLQPQQKQQPTSNVEIV
jgi:hypothetical protein